MFTVFYFDQELLLHLVDELFSVYAVLPDLSTDFVKLSNESQGNRKVMPKDFQRRIGFIIYITWAKNSPKLRENGC